VIRFKLFWIERKGWGDMCCEA